jgi:hypothetical protein
LDKEVMMADPMDADHCKGQYEADELGDQRRYGNRILPEAGVSRQAWRAQFEYEQGQDNRKDPVAESFQPFF